MFLLVLGEQNKISVKFLLKIVRFYSSVQNGMVQAALQFLEKIAHKNI